ncbi:MAG: hypothetical protein E5Y15_32470 [Mesorhizobium sp.]|nr:MAG: hypothetical protein E5Y15_32470 [Mesorhizobium sp.]
MRQPEIETEKGGPRAAQLEPDAMLQLGLTTGPQLVDELTGATICKSVPKPDNCRVTPSANAAEAPRRAVASRRPIIDRRRWPVRSNAKRAVLGLPFLLICVHPACLFRYAGACGVVAKPCCKPAKLN